MNRNLRFGLIAAGVALVLAVAVTTLPPTQSLRGKIEYRVAEATGRTFRINGPLTFTLFPAIGLRAENVTLANAPGGRASNMVEIADMRLAVRLIPLLAGRLEVTHVVLDHPRIALQVAPDGVSNWTFVRRQTMQSGLRVPAAATFADLTITDGSISYDNARLGIHRRISDLDASATLTRLGEPIASKGSFAFQGKRFSFDNRVATLRTLFAGRATTVDVEVDADSVHAGFHGSVSSDGSATGKGRLKTPSLRELCDWLGRRLPAGNGFGALTTEANLVVKDRRVALTNIKATLDGMTIAGAIAADLRTKVPAVNGSLRVDRVELNTYLNAGKPKISTHSAESTGWGKQAVSLALLRIFNGQLALDVGGLTIRHLHLGRSRIAVTLQDGMMQAHMNPMTLYGGGGKAELSVDTRGTVPVFHNVMALTHIAMQPFLTDAMGIDRLGGTGSLTLDVTSRGASPDAVMHGLSGTGAISILGGDVRGVDMGRMARTIETILSVGATGQSATTDFDAFGGSFSIRDGILWNGDLKLNSAFIHMSGQGHVDLGNQTIDYKLSPRASIGGRMEIVEIGVPFTMSGPWSHVHYMADMAGAVTGLVESVFGIH